MGLKTKALLLGGLAGAVYWQNAALDRHRLICAHPALPKAFDGFSILHLSDLHFGSESMARRKALSLKFGRPDLIAVTGDLLDRYTPEYLQTAGEWMERACRIAPVYYVPGNHEAKDLKHYPQVRKVLEQAGATLLENLGCCSAGETSPLDCLGFRIPGFLKEKRIFPKLSGNWPGRNPSFPFCSPTVRNGWYSTPRRHFLWCCPATLMGDRYGCPEFPGCMPPIKGCFLSTLPGCTGEKRPR